MVHGNRPIWQEKRNNYFSIVYIPAICTLSSFFLQVCLNGILGMNTKAHHLR